MGMNEIKDFDFQKIKDFTIYEDWKTINVGDMSEKPIIFHIINAERGQMCFLPANYVDLCGENYIFTLYANILNSQGIKLIESTEHYVCNWKPKMKQKIILQAFGSVVLSRRVPEKPSNKLILKGINAALLHYYGAMKDFDITLTTFGDANHINSELFGDAWAKNFKTEGYIINHLINFLRKSKLDETQFKEYIKPIGMILQKNGYKAKHHGPIFSAEEQQYLTFHLENTIGLFKNQSIQTCTQLIEFKRELTVNSKKLRNYRMLVKDIVSQRTAKLYPANTPKSEMKRLKSTAVSRLIENLVDTNDYSVFNPCKVLRLDNISIPDEMAEVRTPQSIKLSFDHLTNDLKSYEHIESYKLIVSVVSRWPSYLNALKIKQ
jgi:hypothetical protein